MVSDLPLVRGVGTVNLVNNQIDYTVKTSIDKNLATMLGRKDKYVGIPIRVYLKGDLLKPTYTVDWLKTLGRTVEKKKKQELLDSIFGKKKKKPAPAPAPAPQTQPAPAPAPQQTQPEAKPKTMEEIRRERKAREKEEKAKQTEDLLKGIFGR